MAYNEKIDYDYKTKIASIILSKGKYTITTSFLIKVPTTNDELWVYALI
jgi:hypothetical protein